ncbi:unnamed protein product, partial [Polarella glacialis]
AIFQQWPHFLISLKREVVHAISTHLDVQGRVLVLHLCWIIGELLRPSVCSNRADIATFFEALETLAYQAISSRDNQNEASPGGAREGGGRGEAETTLSGTASTKPGESRWEGGEFERSNSTRSRATESCDFHEESGAGSGVGPPTGGEDGRDDGLDLGGKVASGEAASIIGQTSRFVAVVAVPRPAVFTPRFVAVIIASLTKLGTKFPEFAPRVVLCLMKMQHNYETDFGEGIEFVRDRLIDSLQLWDESRDDPFQDHPSQDWIHHDDPAQDHSPQDKPPGPPFEDSPGLASKSQPAQGCPPKSGDDNAHLPVRWDVVLCGAAVSACERGHRWQWALDLLQEALHVSVALNVVIFSSAMGACEKVAAYAAVGMSACRKSFHWRGALGLLLDAAKLRIEPDETTLGAAVCACEASVQWAAALQLLLQAQLGGARSSSVSANAALGACQQGLQWVRALLRQTSQPSTWPPARAREPGAGSKRRGFWRKLCRLPRICFEDCAPCSSSPPPPNNINNINNNNNNNNNDNNNNRWSPLHLACKKAEPKHCQGSRGRVWSAHCAEGVHCVRKVDSCGKRWGPQALQICR